MSPTHHYLYDKCDIILSKTNAFTMFSMRSQFGNKHPVSDVISYCGTFGCVWLAQHISLKITSKRCFLFIRSAY